MVSTAPLVVPAALSEQLRVAVGRGTALGTAFAREHGAFDRRGMRAAIVADLPAPPGAAVQQQELQMMHEIAATRTESGARRARSLYASGEGRLWRQTFDRLHAQAPLSDAAAGAALLTEALESAGAITTTIKHRYARPRPFAADPTLTTVVRRPGGATSYPSSHASRSFAAASVLGALWPSQASDVAGMAIEVAFSRVYGGVHFPTDIAAGATIGAAIGAAVVRTAWPAG